MKFVVLKMQQKIRRAYSSIRIIQSGESKNRRRVSRYLQHLNVFFKSWSAENFPEKIRKTSKKHAFSARLQYLFSICHIVQSLRLQCNIFLLWVTVLFTFTCDFCYMVIVLCFISEFINCHIFAMVITAAFLSFVVVRVWLSIHHSLVARTNTHLLQMWLYYWKN